MSRRPLRIGLSARIYHPVVGATGLQSKSLQYLEQSVAHWVMSRDVMVFMIPAVSGDAMVHRSSIRLSDYPEYLDGLILQGGADISPQSYGEEPLHPDWAGDRVRDAYEMELLHEFMEAGKAVLGICRGAQLINVALGGTLYQDIATQIETAGEHVHSRLRPAQPCGRVGHQVRLGEALSGQDRRAGGVDTSSGDQGIGSGPAGRSAQHRGRPDRSHSPARQTVCAGPAVAPGVPSPRQRGSVGLHADPRRVSRCRARPILVSGSERC
jgi:gamma-glutamyl-gamma-aminobutyrate hydrolase PuuD